LKDKQTRNKQIQKEIENLKQFKKIQSNLEKIFNLQSKHIFREMDSYYEKKECLVIINHIIDDIDRIVFLMKKDLQEKHNRFINKRNKSTGQRNKNKENKSELLNQQKLNFFENLTVFSKMINNDIEHSLREEKYLFYLGFC
jgi:hypothetical protein